jgi:hypothetical protein
MFSVFEFILKLASPPFYLLVLQRFLMHSFIESKEPSLRFIQTPRAWSYHDVWRTLFTNVPTFSTLALHHHRLREPLWVYESILFQQVFQ